MKAFIFPYYLLSLTQLWGGISTFLLLIVSFLIVHAVKLSSKGYLFYKQIDQVKDSLQEKTAENETTAEKKTSNQRKPTPAPVYYLVEKKRIRKKPTEYADPKRIRFQNEEEYNN